MFFVVAGTLFSTFRMKQTQNTLAVTFFLSPSITNKEIQPDCPQNLNVALPQNDEKSKSPEIANF